MSVYEDEKYLFAYQQALHKADDYWREYDPYDNPDNYTGTVPSSEYGVILSNHTNGIKVEGTSDADYIYNNASNVSIYGYMDKDTIRIDSYASKEHPEYINVNVLIFGGAGNDVIQNYGADKSTIYGGGGDDTVDNWGKDVTINGGAGNDFLWGGAENSVIEYSSGDGNDTVAGFGATTTLKIGSDTYTTQKSGSDIVVTVGDGKIILSGAASLSTVHIQGSATGGSPGTVISNSDANSLIRGTSDDDTITNTGHHATIYGGAGRDSIENTTRGAALSLAGSYSYIDAGEDDDYILNHDYADGSFVDGGAGNDTIMSRAANSTIFGGAGSDSIRNVTGSVSINGGSGNDFIVDVGFISGINNNNTIAGGEGNDTVSLSSSGYNNVIQYNSGDGNDVIYNFDSTSTLQIGGGFGTYSTTASGSDILVTVGESTITLEGAANLSIVHINYETITPPNSPNVITGTEGADSIYNTLDSMRIDALGGNDTINNGDQYYNYQTGTQNNGGPYVTINAGAGDDDVYSRRANFVSINGGDGNDTIYTSGSSYVTTEAGAGNDYIFMSGNWFYNDEGIFYIYAWELSIDGGEGNDTIDNWYSEYSTVNAGTGDDRVYSHQSNFISINGGAGNDDLTLSYNEYSTILGGADNDEILSWHSNNSKINGGAGNDSISLTDDSENILIQYTEGDGNDTVEGFNADDTLDIAGSSYSTKTSGSNIIVTVGKGKITLVGAASLSSANINFSKTAWTINGTTAEYGTSNNVLATVKGVKSLDGLSLSKKVVTVSAASLNKSKVTISDGYTLKLGKDVEKPSTTKAWSLSGTKAAYKQTTTEGYTLADNAINYSKKSVEALATVKGVKSLDGIRAGGNKITLKNSALKSKVTIGGGYEFDFAKDYTQSTISGSAGNDSITARGKKISISGGEGDDTIKILGKSTTVTGGKGNDSLWGSSYADTFIYAAGDGKDVIYGFDDKDTLTLDGLDFKSSSYRSKTGALTLKLDNGSITLKDFTATTFNINGDTYKITNGKFGKK